MLMDGVHFICFDCFDAHFYKQINRNATKYNIVNQSALMA